ncbi:hypothetical protein SPRG_17396 [Saprolegnia parasitica CBS 223.65]|uniref:folate gamma-glutamyl hydrolase n=1 Tax=Saprolegnia parasitica (strain CBS 223.65) TaxID=695850 RepID=A0A067BR48_SAPPC|nr:hypothetical protein SPRG_17396 [Saprolegnia parasitica CBS 223.65]KDO17147.1 hypothetical protein SPRG_17396 [Saprolegnia parasitica CBS 223.65]|eukprot:XP_012212144.1 hypothetical protein SPRG_17396 [Saprolegnia parasitica CBS 223.65]
MVDAATVPILPKAKPASSLSRRLVLALSLALGCLLAVTTTRTTPVAPIELAQAAPNTVVLTPNPIIGVFSHPTTNPSDGGPYEYIAASYIKWIESAGGRAVRIPFTAPESELTRLLSGVNGLLFPGGDPLPNAQAKFLLESAIALNQNGTYFPVWGTCLGFEWLVQLTAQDNGILDKVDAQNMSSTISYTPSAASSRLFSYSRSFDALTTAPLTANFHHYGITKAHFDATPSLTAFFKALATSLDRQGVSYVSAIEAVEFPIYGLQFHPEKNPYEFGRLPSGVFYGDIDHSYPSLLAAQAFAHFFIGEAKKNAHAFPSFEIEFENILYNHAPSAAHYPGFESVYLFKPFGAAY